MIDDKTMTFKKKVVIKLLIFLLLHVIGFFIFFFYANAGVSAQTSPASAAPFEIGVSPPTAYLRIQPGVSAMHSIAVTNNSETAITVRPEIVSFETDGVSGHPVLLDQLDFAYIDENRTNLDAFTIQPGDNRQLPIYITVPGNAPLAEHKMTILLRQQLGSNASNTSSVGGVVGSNLIVLVASEAEIASKFSISDWQTARVIDSLGSLSAAPIVTNQTVAAQVASGSAKIKGPFGQTVAEYTMFSDVVLGSSSRQLRWLNTDEAASAALADESVIIDSILHKQAFLLGPYTIEIKMHTIVDESIQNQVFEYTIIALPFSIIIFAGIGGVLAFLYVRFGRKAEDHVHKYSA